MTIPCLQKLCIYRRKLDCRICIVQTLSDQMSIISRKCVKCDNLGHIAKECRKSRITHVRNAAKRGIFQSVATLDNREIAPLAVNHTVVAAGYF